MTTFDRMDSMVSKAVGRLLNQKIIWQPRRKKTPANEYTNEASENDPTRARKTLEGIASWKADVIDAGDVRDQAVVLGFSCVVDFDLEDFARPGQPGVFDTPRAGDHFVLTEEYQGNNVVEVGRVGDDGSRRVHYYCNIPGD